MLHRFDSLILLVASFCATEAYQPRLQPTLCAHRICHLCVATRQNHLPLVVTAGELKYAGH